MKLSQTQRLISLCNERRSLILLLDALETGDDIDITVGGWPADVGEANPLLEQVAQLAEANAKAELDRIETEIAALGVDIDVPREAYTRTKWPEMDGDEDDYTQPEAHEVADAAG